jgi:hypothetical protein
LAARPAVLDVEPAANSCRRAVGVDLDVVGFAVDRPVGIVGWPAEGHEVGAGSRLHNARSHLDSFTVSAAVALSAPTSLRAGAARLASSVGLAGDNANLHHLLAVEIDDLDVVRVVDAQLVGRDVIGGIGRPHLVDVEELPRGASVGKFSSNEACCFHTAGSPRVRPVKPEGSTVDPPPVGGRGAGGSKTFAMLRWVAAQFFACSSVRLTVMR